MYIYKFCIASVTVTVYHKHTISLAEACSQFCAAIILILLHFIRSTWCYVFKLYSLFFFCVFILIFVIWLIHVEVCLRCPRTCQNKSLEIKVDLENLSFPGAFISKNWGKTELLYFTFKATLTAVSMRRCTMRSAPRLARALWEVWTRHVFTCTLKNVCWQRAHKWGG